MPQYHFIRHGPGVLGWLFFVVFVVMAVLVAVAVVRWWRSPGHDRATTHTRPLPGSGIEPALAELRMRYARGEITWEEYAQRATNLGYPVHGPGGPPGGYGSWPQWPPGTPPASPPPGPAPTPS